MSWSYLCSLQLNADYFQTPGKTSLTTSTTLTLMTLPPALSTTTAQIIRLLIIPHTLPPPSPSFASTTLKPMQPPDATPPASLPKTNTTLVSSSSMLYTHLMVARPGQQSGCPIPQTGPQTVKSTSWKLLIKQPAVTR